MKKIFSIMFLLIVGCSSEKETVSASSYSMILSCKYNPSAMYTDKFYFSKDMSTIKRTSDNKQIEEENYTTEKISSNEYIIKGTLSVIDINNNKTKYPDSNLYVLNKEGSKYWVIYYFEDYNNDATRLWGCNQS
jgi:hypothetical protein